MSDPEKTLATMLRIAGLAIAVHVARNALRNAMRDHSEPSACDGAQALYTKACDDLDEAMRDLPLEVFALVQQEQAKAAERRK